MPKKNLPTIATISLCLSAIDLLLTADVIIKLNQKVYIILLFSFLRNRFIMSFSMFLVPPNAFYGVMAFFFVCC